MKNCTKKCACTAATVASAKHSEYDYYNRKTAKRQAVKNRRSNGVNMALALVGLLLLVAASGADEAGLPEYSVAAKLYRLRRDDLLPKVGRGRRKRITTEDEDIAALMARFSAACAVIKEACGQDGSASGKEGKSGE